MASYPQPKISLDIPFFWEKQSLFSPIPMDQWKHAFTIALYAKTNVDVEEIRYFSPRPEFVLSPPEALAAGVEMQQQRAGHELRCGTQGMEGNFGFRPEFSGRQSKG